MYIGNHLSTTKGYAAMGKMAVELGANTFAFFTRNPRGGKAKEMIRLMWRGCLTLQGNGSLARLWRMRRTQ